MTRARWFIALIVLTILYSIALVLTWQSVYQPYERPPKLTSAEDLKAKKARMKNGYFTQINCQKGVYTERHGESIWIIRRGKQ